MICIIIVLFFAIFPPGMAAAGVIIQQKITMGHPGKPGSVTHRELIFQDDKEKFSINDHVSAVFDARNRTAILLDSAHKMFRELPTTAAPALMLDPNHLLYATFKSTGKTHTILGYRCRDYSATSYGNPLIIATIACFSTQPAGAREFHHFVQAVLKSGPHQTTNSLPPGMPLMIESIGTVNLAIVPPDVSPQEAARFKNRIAKIPPQVTHVEVTKITSKKLPPQEFGVPPGYTRQGPAPH